MTPVVPRLSSTSSNRTTYPASGLTGHGGNSRQPQQPWKSHPMIRTRCGGPRPLPASQVPASWVSAVSHSKLFLQPSVHGDPARLNLTITDDCPSLFRPAQLGSPPLPRQRPPPSTCSAAIQAQPYAFSQVSDLSPDTMSTHACPAPKPCPFTRTLPQLRPHGLLSQGPMYSHPPPSGTMSTHT